MAPTNTPPTVQGPFTIPGNPGIQGATTVSAGASSAPTVQDATTVAPHQSDHGSSIFTHPSVNRPTASLSLQREAAPRGPERRISLPRLPRRGEGSPSQYREPQKTLGPRRVDIIVPPNLTDTSGSPGQRRAGY